MSDSSIDRAIFAFLASCVGDFTQWPQCSTVALRGNDEGGRLFGVLFKVTARNPNDRTVFRIIITKGEAWQVRIIQVSNHVLRDERPLNRGGIVDRSSIVDAVNYFASLTGMVKDEEGR